MDIGSIFPLYDLNIKNEEEKNIKWKNKLSLCREALFLISVRKFNNKKVLIPSYTCSSVYEPFIQNGWECLFYKINLDLTINSSDLMEKYNMSDSSVCVIHPFYGMSFNNEEQETISLIQNKGCIIVEDITQSIFKPYDGLSDYYVGSLRKWFAIPDGGFIYSKDYDFSEDINKLEENLDFVNDQVCAMYLRGVYFKNKDENIKKISISINKRAVTNSYLKIIPHKISNFSDSLLKKENIKLQSKRKNNYVYLMKNINFNNGIRPVIKDQNRIIFPPLYFPIYCENRKKVQNILSKNHIYAPILWPKEIAVSFDEDVEYIYSHILAIPIDQRYSLKDMKKICRTINLLEK